MREIAFLVVGNAGVYLFIHDLTKNARVSCEMQRLDVCVHLLPILLKNFSQWICTNLTSELGQVRVSTPPTPPHPTPTPMASVVTLMLED
jgi:hypothetical protein